MKIRRLVSVLVIAILASSPAWPDPGPGDVFREYLWTSSDHFLRVTDPDARHPGAREFLPNPVNTITLGDLEGATRAEAYIEQWGGHAGTSDKRLRLNGNPWIDVPEPEGIPGDAGTYYENAECYQYASYPSVPVPLDQLLPGENSFEFTCGGQICFDFGWGQWGVWSVVFRIYYDDAKPHATGRIVDPVPGAAFGDSLHILLETDDTNVEQVDFIGLYEDFDYEGNGLYRQWHYNLHRGKIFHHLGTAAGPPYAVTWKTDWVPDQDQPVRLMARVRNADGIYYMTESIDGLRLTRDNRSVQLYKPFEVPGGWQTRAHDTHRCKIFVVHDLRRATAAQMILTAWGGGDARAIGLNDSTIVSKLGWGYTYNEKEVPLHFIRRGTNQFFTYATTPAHGIEVLWPGIALKVQYAGSRDEIQLPVTAREERIYADDLSPHWQLEEPRDLFFHETLVDLEAAEQTFQGDAALGLESPERFWELKLKRDDPLHITPYRALRFAIRLHSVQIPEGELSGWLRLYIDERDPVQLLGADTAQVDMDSPEWQTVEIPLDSSEWRFPYLESLRFYGDFTGRFFIDDIRLVLREESTSILAEEARAVPAAFLSANFPNPFNSRTQIRVYLPAAARAELSVFNLSGQKVATLLDGRCNAGVHTVNWDGRDRRSKDLSSGVYLYQLRVEGRQVETRKLLLLK